MKALWAPWRREYIMQDAANEACFICAGAKAQEAELERHLVLFRNGEAVAMLNRYPYNTGHLLVAPVRHVAEPEELSEGEVGELWELLCRVKGGLERVSRPDGFNIGINLGESAGAGLPGHIHVHVVPRWTGDTNFMPVLGETKVMSESLDGLYRKLREALMESC